MAETDLIAQIERLTERLQVAGSGSAEAADILLKRGKAYWKLGDKAKAISDYAAAAEIDPDGPAAEALRMSRSIMNFYNTDLYNP